jgi:osmotically inducible protein OsmC
MDTIKPLFTATATATGGRNGHTEASDGSVRADLSVPKAMGGPGKPGTATPEHLFAAGYAACFGGALDFVGKQHNKDASKARVTADVSIGPRDGGGFGLAVKLRVEDPSLPQAELAALAKEAHEKSARTRMPPATMSTCSSRSRAVKRRISAQRHKREERRSRAAPSKIDALHLRLGIAQTGDGIGRNGLGNFGDIRGGQVDRCRADVLGEPFNPLGAGNRHDIVALRQQPSERQLARRASLAAGNIGDAMNQSQVRRKILRGKPRMSPPRIGLRQAFRFFDDARHQAAAERGISD